MNGKIDATPVKPWFPLIVADWLDSDDVQQMTTSERGVYITLLVHQWMLGRLPAKVSVLEKVSGIERRILGRFLGKYRRTFVQVSGNPEKIANRKLHKLQTGRDLAFFHSPEENREEEKEREEITPNEDGSEIEDISFLPVGRNRKAQTGRRQCLANHRQPCPRRCGEPREQMMESEGKPGCKRCGGSGREIFREPNPKDPIGYNEMSRQCECVQ